jgi:hypothetical protein
MAHRSRSREISHVVSDRSTSSTVTELPGNSWEFQSLAAARLSESSMGASSTTSSYTRKSRVVVIDSEDDDDDEDDYGFSRSGRATKRSESDDQDGLAPPKPFRAFSAVNHRTPSPTDIEAEAFPSLTVTYPNITVTDTTEPASHQGISISGLLANVILIALCVSASLDLQIVSRTSCFLLVPFASRSHDTPHATNVGLPGNVRAEVPLTRRAVKSAPVQRAAKSMLQRARSQEKELVPKETKKLSTERCKG